MTKYLALLLLLCSCSLLKAAPPRVERFNCQVRALEPLVGDVLDAEQLVKDLYAGRANLNAVLANLEVKAAEALELMSALRACEPPPPESEPAEVMSSLGDAGSGA